jgi:transcription antitermination protein NusB
VPRRRRPGEDPRSAARERALTLLYEAETKGIAPGEVIAGLVMPPDDDTRLLVEGVADTSDVLDPVIAAHATGWALDRMPALDRIVLRLAAFELSSRPEVPVAVVLDEAVTLAKRFSTDDSGRFVNGVLAAIAPLLRDPVGDPPDSSSDC